MVQRTQYADKIRKLLDQQVIKGVTYVRRCSKSTLLIQFQAYLLDYPNCYLFPDEQSVFINNLAWIESRANLPGPYSDYSYYDF